MKMFTVIAIDGGAGTGKSTTAQLISSQFKFLHVDTGSHYRSVTAALINCKISEEDASDSQNLNKIELDSEIHQSKSVVTINGLSYPKEFLRSAEINAKVSSYSSVPSIRSLLLDYQQSQLKLAQRNNFSGLVMEGRDIGTVILPEADLKLFLTANESVRNLRRQEDGETDQIAIRDRLDSSRKIAPLIQSTDSIVIDTALLSKEDVLSKVSQLIHNL